MSILGANEVTDVRPYKVIVIACLVPFSAALGGLLYYLLYIFSGWRRAWVGVALLYGFFFAYLAFLVGYHDMVRVEITQWTVRTLYAPDMARDAAPLAAFIVPHVVGAIAYASLLFTTTDPTRRYRIGLVSGAILVWFATGLGAGLTGLSRAAWWPYAGQVLGLAAALTILAAYVPPPWVRVHFRVEAAEPAPRPPGAAVRLAR